MNKRNGLAPNSYCVWLDQAGDVHALSQAELGRRVGLSASMVFKLIHGQRGSHASKRVEVAKQEIARLLGATYAEMWGD